MEQTPKPPLKAPVLSGAQEGSFAHLTIRDRLPVLLAKTIDALRREGEELASNKDRSATSPSMLLALQQLIEGLGTLKQDMSQDQGFVPCRPVAEGGWPDAEHWNAAIQSLARERASWFRASWLFAECYMYRRVQELVTLAARDTNTRPLDVFASQKQAAFHGSLPSIRLLAAKLEASLHPTVLADGTQTRPLLEQFLHYSLWGNQADLSLRADADASTLHETQASDDGAIEQLTPNILVNHTSAIVDRWLGHRSVHEQGAPGAASGMRIDVILDNAGFELFSDCCLLDFLTATGIARYVVLHVKSFPWFVSDTVAEDVEWMLQACAADTAAGGANALHLAARRWRAHLTSGRWRVYVDPYWTLPDPYWTLPRATVYQEQLSASDFLLFKGDLNYRKMLYDADWPLTTPFAEAIGPMHDARTPDMALLRTCKSDPVVGLSEEQVDILRAISDWRVSGQFGVVQLHLRPAA